MATSKSNEPGPRWTAELSIFSGRRDPVWAVSAEAASALEAIWESLTPSAEAPPASPPLGYRGCQLSDNQGRVWHAYRNTVTLTTQTGEGTRADGERLFEKSLIETAPPEILPPPIVEIVLQNQT